jgi:hypothetical protein
MSEPLAHRHYDTFELPEAPESPGGLLPGQLALSFSTDREGNIASVAVPFEPLVKDIAFTRELPRRISQSCKANHLPFVGTEELGMEEIHKLL